MSHTKSSENRQLIRNRIQHNHCLSEEDAVARLLPLGDIHEPMMSGILHRAKQLCTEIRHVQSHKNSVDVLLREFSLSTEEGVLLMCLAEALLRIPDKHTQDQLIRDKLLGGDWSVHLQHSDSMFVNASAWGLLLTGKVISLKEFEGQRSATEEKQWSLLKNTIARLGEPVIRLAMNTAIRIMSTQFVLGEDFDSAFHNSESEILKGYTYSYDMLGEGARTALDAERHMQAYEEALTRISGHTNGTGPIEGPGLSVKLSALHPRFEYSQRKKVMQELVSKIKKLSIRARELDVGLTIDAEEANRLDLTLDIVEAMFMDPELSEWNGFGLAVQSYQKSAIDIVDWLIDLAKEANKVMMVRLVKGAYWDSEIKRSQVGGFPDYPVFTRKSATDLCFLACARKLLANRGIVYPQFATHNAVTASAILELAKEPSLLGDMDFEFQRLHGMGNVLFDRILESKEARCRIYAPVGTHQDLLAYLVRRILENGANSSFVNKIVDESIPLENLLYSPIDEIKGCQPKQNPAIPLPAAIFGNNRKNSLGLDLTDRIEIDALQIDIDKWHKPQPVVKSRGITTVLNPANTDEMLGNYKNSDEDDMQNKLSMVSSGLASWSGLSVEKRASCLEKLSRLLEKNRNELVVLCTREAGKCLADSIAEVREAVDFCNYYAQQARIVCGRIDAVKPGRKKVESQEPLGVVLCISPWNFPLAIFLGQISAALVTGNTVLAKPSEQTTLIAVRTTELMREAGIPAEAYQLITGPGKNAGEVLVHDRRIAGVMFTGSTDTACWIARELANRGGLPARLIAETGGQNAMIVDSTALLERVVDDVILSGFGSAGQRCSSLRVLYVQDEIADKLITMLQGAMCELVIGNPLDIATDIGPLIDHSALSVLQQHQVRMEREAKLIYQCEVPGELEQGHFYGPVLYELDNISALEKEVFGPAIHVIRYAANETDQVIDEINKTGYGLTLGIHSRITSKAEYIARHVKAGNVYVNRNMIGAIVGVQPFGGCGLSGTGPKAGGPRYLPRLLRERTDIHPDKPIRQPGAELITTSAWPISKPAAGEIDKAMVKFTSYMNEGFEVADGCLSNLVDLIRISKSEQRKTFTAVTRIEAVATPFQERVRNILTESVNLQGATGEFNELRWEPRGNVICFCSGKHTNWIQATLIALLTGNRVVLGYTPGMQSAAIQLVELLCDAGFSPNKIPLLPLHWDSELQYLLQHRNVDAVAVSVEDAPVVNRILRQREGELIPLLTGSLSDSYVHGFMREKTISIDTTAAGGNASLLIAASDPTDSIREKHCAA